MKQRRNEEDKKIRRTRATVQWVVESAEHTNSTHDACKIVTNKKAQEYS
jgi:hypothetical protein